MNNEYKRILDIAEKYSIDSSDLLIAQNCYQVFDFDYSDDQFEKLCKKASTVYYGCSKDVGVSVYCVARAIDEFICDDEKSIEDVLLIDSEEIHYRALDFC